MKICDRTTWLRATFKEREYLVDSEEIEREVDDLLDDNQTIIKDHKAVEGIESFIDSLEKTLKTNKETFISDLHSFLKDKDIQVCGFEDYKPSVGFIDTILKFIASIWHFITDLFSNRLKSIQRSFMKMKANYKSRTLKDTFDSLNSRMTGLFVIPELKPNFSSLRWIAQSADVELAFMKNIFKTFPIMEKYLGKKISYDELTQLTSDGLTGGEKLIHDMIKEISKEISSGFKTTRFGKDSVIAVPGRYFQVDKDDLNDFIKKSPSSLGIYFSTYRDDNGFINGIEKAFAKNLDQLYFVEVNNSDVEALIKSLENLLSEMTARYKSPTSVGRKMEGIVDKTFKDSNIPGKNKKEVAKFFTSMLRITKSLTNTEFFTACSFMEKGISVVNGCLKK